MPLAAGEEIAGYTIVRSLGAGGMGEVYLAQHPRLPRYDALKVLSATVCADSEYRERFSREADIAATLWHQHIVEVHDRGDVDGQLWISMDYVEGTDAHRLLTESYPDGMPPDDVVRIVTAVADALDYAHERGLLHRDVKPANILLANPGTANERIMLADFGIARRIGDTSNLTGTNMTVGTVAYAAPEQLMGEGIDGRADQYALAATAFQLLTGTPPFQHTNPAVVISQHLTSDPPSIGTRRPELSNLGPAFSKALAKSPHDRFAKCLDFARALAHRTDATISGSGLTWDGPGTGDIPQSEPTMSAQLPAGASRPRHSASPTTSGPRWVLPAAIAVILIILAAGAYVRFDRGRDRPTEARTPLTTTSAPAPAPAPPPGGVVLPVVVVGAECGTLGQAGVTETGAQAYCAHLSTTDASIWSTIPGEISSPTVTPGPNDIELPSESQQPVLVCMEQTGKSHLDCHNDILEVNESATPSETESP